MVFQEPMTALDPLKTIGDQVAETPTVDDEPSVQLLEQGRRQALAPGAEGLPDHADAAARQADAAMVPVGLDEEDVADGDEVARGPERQQGAVILAERAPLCRARLVAHALDCPRETGLVHRLEEIVDGVDLEGAQGVLVVGGHEDHRRGLRQGREHLEAVPSRQHHIHQGQIPGPLRL